MAEKYNAVIAISGDYYANDPAKTSYEYRMGQKIRNKRNRKKDILIIDTNGDFHLFVKSDEAEMKEFGNASIARHKVPRYFLFVNEFPMNAAGKILKYKMREDAAKKLGLK